MKNPGDHSGIVHGLWIGNSISLIEKLTMVSFLAHDYSFWLWSYNKIEGLDPRVKQKNASEIIPEKEIFSYKFSNKYGHGKGSYAGFSDLFRYKLLYEYGGWWTDMDITCLNPLPTTEYFFRFHHSLPLVGNLMYVKKNSELMLYCYERAKAEVDENNRDWHKPIQILIDGVKKFNLNSFIQKDMGSKDDWSETRNYIFKRTPFPKKWFYVHWQNEEWRAKRIPKNDINPFSSLGSLAIKYNLIELEKNPITLIVKKLKFLAFAIKY